MYSKWHFHQVQNLAYFLSIVVARDRPGIQISFRFRLILWVQTKFRFMFRLVGLIRFRIFYTLPTICLEFRNETKSESESKLKMNFFITSSRPSQLSAKDVGLRQLAVERTGGSSISHKTPWLTAVIWILYHTRTRIDPKILKQTVGFKAMNWEKTRTVFFELNQWK